MRGRRANPAPAVTADSAQIAAIVACVPNCGTRKKLVPSTPAMPPIVETA